MSLLLVSALMAAEPDDKQLPLLKTFREEFILVTPGRGRDPTSFTMGSPGSAPSVDQPAPNLLLPPYQFDSTDDCFTVCRGKFERQIILDFDTRELFDDTLHHAVGFIDNIEIDDDVSTLEFYVL